MDILKTYIRALFAYARAKAWISLILMVILGLTQGIGLLLIIPFLGIIGIGAASNQNEISNAVTDVFQAAGISADIYSILIVYLVIISLHAGIKRFHEILNTRIVFEFTQHLRNRLYGHLCRMSWLGFLKTRESDIIHVLTSDLQSVSFATQQLLMLLGSAVIVGIQIVVAFIISLPMTLAAIGCGGVFMLLLHTFHRQAVTFGKKLRQSRNDMFSAVTEHLGGMKIAKSYNHELRHITHFSRITDNITKQMIRFSKINSTTKMIYQIGTALAITILLVAGVKLIKIPSVNLMVIVFIFTRLLPGFSGLQQSVQLILNAMPSFKAIHDMEQTFKSDRETDKPAGAEHGAVKRFALTREIRFENVSFRYLQSQPEWILKGVNLVIPANAMTALTGPSGAGKSTIADLTLGLLVPEYGRILVDGQALDGNLIRRWRNSIGYVPQDAFLFHESVRNNLLRAAPSATEAELSSALQMASAYDFVSKLPQGMDTIVGDRGIRLSGGERQRICLAGALLRNPTFLMLDEATSALDKENEGQIHNAIENLHGELTILVIAHRLSSIARADHLIEIHGEGKSVPKEIRHPVC